MIVVLSTNQEECESNYCIISTNGFPNVCSVTGYPTMYPTPSPVFFLHPQVCQFMYSSTPPLAADNH